MNTADKLKDFYLIRNKKTNECILHATKNKDWSVCEGSYERLTENGEVYFFDSIDEAQDAFPELKFCPKCSTLSKKRSMGIGWWSLIFAILCGVTGYLIATDSNIGRILVGIIFAVLGFGAFIITQGLILSHAEKKYVKLSKQRIIFTVTSIILCGIMFCVMISSIGVGGTPLKTSPYDDVFRKDPNKWTQSEKDHVNNMLGDVWTNN